MKNNRPLFVLGLMLAVSAILRTHGAQIVGDNFNVTGSGSGFALGSGVNSGINPPTTRLTGPLAPGLRYINTGTKATTAYTITSNKLRVTPAASPGRFILSADGTSPFNFAPALGTAAATPATPVVYEVSLSMDNDSVGIQRFSFAIATAEGDANNWDFGVQVYRTASGNTFYTIGKRIDTGSCGLAADLNSPVHSMAAGTYGTEITILMRVTDAGAETSTFNSRVQLSLNGGWIYDTATDPDLSGTGWRLDGAGRYFMWDVAPDAGNVTYDNFSLNWISGARTWTGGGADNNWNTALNWGGAVPVNGSALTFSGTARQTSTNNISGLSVPSVTLNNGGFALYGNAVTVTSGITNVTGSSTLNAPITLAAALRLQSLAGSLTLGGINGSGQALTVGGAGNTTIAGVIATGAGTVTKNDSGTLTLSGANTYSGATAINAGTLALAAGGSIANSTTITIANGTTLDVTAASFALGAGQTLMRNSTSGVGNVNGSMTLNSGATISLQMDGTATTVGTLSIAGGLTLNANVIAINISGNPLNIGTYPLISYTGSKNGSFNAATLTGSGLAMGLAARIVESAGTISLQVYLPAHGIAAGNIKVVENDLANTAESVTVTATTALNGFAIRTGSSRGDYAVQIGVSGTDDLANGALLSSVAENGRDHGEDSGINYCSSAVSFTSGGYFIPTANAPDGKEYNINVAAAYFPYNKWLGGYARNSSGTAGGPNDLLTASPGLILGTHFVDNGGGISTVNLTSLGINSQTDGVLLVTSGANDDNFASTSANTNGTWTIRIKDNGTNGAAFEQDPVAFAFIPKNNMSVISGKFQGDGTPLIFSGPTPRFTVVNTGDGTWRLSIPGYTPANGVLIVSAEGGDGANQDNLISYQASGNDWIIQSRDIPGMGLQTLTGPVASFVFIPGPTATLVAPADNSNVSSSPTLTVNVSNTVPGNVTVTFYGHEEPKPGPGKDFLIPVLPDTQNYAREVAGSGDATRFMWYAQTDWIVANRVSENIPFVATLGDCVQNGDIKNGSPNNLEWQIATNAYYRIEDQSSTLLLSGIPYGVTVGNHDQSPNGDPDGTTDIYNQYFGTSHFNGKSYYGGHFGSNNDSWYDLFSAGGLDFIVISFEYGRYGSTILGWAQNLLDTYPDRRCIVLTHHAGDDNADVNATTTSFSTQGSAIYDALKTYPNFFLMLGGHVFDEGGEGRRTDTYNGHTVRTLVSDYQGRFNGGNGLMRLMYFSPSNNLVSVKTYSPYTDNYETDANSQFSFSYNMKPNGAGTPGTPYAAIKTNANVAHSDQSSYVWSGLQADKPYAWYVTVTTVEGDYSTSPEWRLNTTSGFSGSALVYSGGDSNGNGLPDDWEALYGISDPDADADGDGQSNYAEYVAKTSPTDAASVFRVLDTQYQADRRVTLTWSSVGGVRYRVQYADSLDGGFTDIVRDAGSETDASPSGQPSVQSFTDNTASTNRVRFYRVKVVP